MSKYTLENRDGELYVKYVFVANDETQQQAVNYWRLGISYAKFIDNVGGEEQAQSLIGCELFPMCVSPVCVSPVCVWQDTRGWKYRLPDIAKYQPEIAELLPLPEKAISKKRAVSRKKI